MASKAPTWADQWGSSDSFGGEADDKFDSKKSGGGGGGGGGNKMSKVKAAAAVGADNAKVAVTAAAQKVKIGTTMGFKWVKDKYQKKKSSSN